jgi:Protein of unknown function (DUF2934)
VQTRLSPAHPESDKLSVSDLQERIRNRAYDLYEKRGALDGHALDDWLDAKAEILGVTASAEERKGKRTA